LGITVIRDNDVNAWRMVSLKPDRIVDLRFLGHGRDVPDPTTVVHLAASLVRAGRNSAAAPALCLITDRSLAALAGDSLDPRRAMLPSLLRSLIREGGIVARHVDIDPANISLDTLLAEIRQSAAEPTVAWRDGSRLVPRLRPLDFPLPENDPKPFLPAGATCIVSGGLGGIGAILCRHLLYQHGSHLVLIGREPVASSPGRQAALDALSREAAWHGGAVVYRQADVADAETLDRALGSLPSSWPDARAVFHLAGEFRLNDLADEQPEAVDRLWRTKALGGARLLDWACARPGCRVCAFSSTATMLPAMGMAAYAAANAAMEATLAGRALTLAWSLWSDTGISRGTPPNSVQGTGLHALSPKKALRSLEAVLPMRSGLASIGLDQGHPVVARLLETAPRPPRTCTVYYATPDRLAPSALRRALAKATGLTDDAGRTIPLRFVPLPALPKNEDDRPDRTRLLAMAEGRNSGTPPRTNLEILTASIWREVLHAGAVMLEDNFFHLGGHSLLAARILERLHRTLGVTLPLAALLQHPTVAGLTQAMTQAAGSMERLEKAARLRLAVDALSPEEVRAQLETLRQHRAKDSHVRS
jgi:NAD(P)-dependent dehydrogenase (short-subunit alcohol dehydrogenase family)